MATSETTLLQFVALALPAVAILMQAILSFHDNYDIGAEDSSTIRTEFRFIELSFIGLVIAGGFFGASLIGTVDSIWGKIGLISMLIGLGFLAPATWFALRRPQYPSQSYDSPEDAAKSGLKYAIGALIPLGILAGGGYMFLEFMPTLRSESSPQELVEVLQLVTIAGVFLIITSSIVRTLTYYRQSIERRKRREEWYSNLMELLEDMEEFLPENPSKPGYSGSMNILVKFEDYEERLERLISKAPGEVDYSELKELKITINTYKEIINNQHDIIDDLGSKHHKREELENKIAEVKNAQQSTQEESERWYELEEEKEVLYNDIEQIKSEINQIEGRRENIQEEIKELLEQLKDEIVQIKEQYGD